MFKISITNQKSNTTTNLRYEDRKEALAVWDKVVEDAIGGYVYQLRQDARIMSEYTPMNKKVDLDTYL